uniref:Uncharacterized protein n=1 Tax=Antithamnionella ternifolia TaxID=207919 RepID=A0A4D6WQW9_9FLOR|nr:hypothetical protein [Antithamnionella ternifolia]
MLSYSLKENVVKNSVVHQYEYINSGKNNKKILLKLNNSLNIASNSLNTQSNDTNYKLISRNFFVKFINQFWEETIFLSPANSLAETYIDKLKVDGLSIYSKEYKIFLTEFSKALINGRINIACNELDFNVLKASNTMHIKYIWRKGLNFSWPQKNSYLLSIFKQMRVSYRKPKFYTQNFSANQLPLFTVVNNLKQIVLSESSNEILINKNFIDYIYNIYAKYFLNSFPANVKYQGLFFINVKDAQEYRNYIESKYLDSSKSKNVHLFVNRLNLYYKLVNSTFKYIDFRLVPDLTEVGNFVSKYQHYKYVKIHKNQKHSNNSFQGQPIYFIEPILAINKSTKKVELVKYLYSSLRKDQKIEYTAVFMNYKTAVLAWQKFRQQMLNYDLPMKPKLTVYNLESFIEQSETDTSLKLDNTLFVPAFESYIHLKNAAILHTKSNILKRMVNHYSSIKVFSQRMLWSLTSRQPLNW